MRFLISGLLLLLASGAGIATFWLIESARPQDSEEALLEDLNREISTQIEIRPTAVNPAAVTKAQAAEVIDELPAVLKELQETGVQLDNEADLTAAVQDSVEKIVEEDEGLRDAVVPALEESLADSIAGEIVQLATPIASNISDELPAQEREDLTTTILESTLEELGEEGISPAEGEGDKIGPVVEEVVEDKVEEAGVQGQVNEDGLKNDLTSAVAAFEGAVTEVVGEDIEEAAEETAAVEGLDQDDLNRVTAAVADQATERLVPDLNGRILEEDLNPGDPADEAEIKWLIDEEITQAVGEVLPEGDPDQLQDLTDGLAVSTNRSIREVGPKFDAPTDVGRWSPLNYALAILSALGISGTVLLGGLTVMGRQVWSPRISTGGVLLRRGDYSTSMKLHSRPDAPPIAFKLAYAGPNIAVLERIEFRPRTGCLRSVAAWFGLEGRHRHSVRTHDAQQLRLDPEQVEPPEFKDLALPMVLTPGDQLFIRAKSREEMRPECTGDENDGCKQVEMIALKLRGNFRPYSFKIEQWEDHEFLRPPKAWRRVISVVLSALGDSSGAELSRD